MHLVVIYTFLLHLAFTDSKSTRDRFKHFLPLAVNDITRLKGNKEENPTLQYTEFQQEIKVEYSAYPLRSKIRNFLHLDIYSFLIPD